jgi:hypothetical protein
MKKIHHNKNCLEGVYNMMGLFQWIKQGRITLTATWLCIGSIIVIANPASILQLSGTAQWSSFFMPYVWILALVTSSFLITQVIVFLVTLIKRNYINYKTSISCDNMIKHLDFEEKAVLREFVIQQKNVLSLPLNEPAVNNLLASGVLTPAYETQEIKGESRIIKLSIAVDAREKLTKKVLGIPSGKMSEHDIINLKAARPDYARTA